MPADTAGEILAPVRPHRSPCRMSDPIPRLDAALRGRYRIEHELGRGGMATVYLAEDLRHERPVALKVLRPELAAAVGPDRFLSEIKTTANLQHPHILPLHDSGEADGLLFYVMPYVEGESLKQRIEREGPLPVEDALRIARQCAGALGYAHGKGVVHRDVKPANILLSEGHAVVADFGIATALHHSGDAERLTGTGVSIGTVGYMSPEQVSGGTVVDGRSDVYALGCVLFEMLAGDRLFRGSTPPAVVARQLAGAESITTVRPNAPAGLDTVIRTACQPTAGDRYRNADEFASALSIPAGGGLEPTGAEPSHATRRRVAAAVAAVLALLAIAWVVSDGRIDGAAEGPRVEGRLPVVAVLPFEDLNPSEEYAYFAAGMHQDVIAQFAALRELTVLPRQAVERYGESVALDSVAEEIQADFLVTATVQRAADEIRLTLDLVESASLAVVHSEQYNRQLTAESMFDIQSEIARDVAAAMAVSISPGEERRLQARPTANLAAWDLYNAGLGAYRYANRDDEDFEIAVARFRAALDVDSGFAPAWAGLADVFAQRVCCQSYPLSWADTALAYARRALELDPDLVRAHQSMAKAHSQFERRDSTIAWHEAALALDPNDAQSLNNISLEARLAGSLDQAVEYALRASRVFPWHPNPKVNAADAYATLGLGERAARWHDRAMELGVIRSAPLEHTWADPESALASSWRELARGETAENPEASFGVLLYLAGSFDEAVEELEGALRVNPSDEARREAHHPTTVLGLALRLSGDSAAARPHLDAAEERINDRMARGGTHWQYAFDLASIRAVGGDTARAFEWLDQAYDWGFRSLGLASRDPALQTLRGEPRFDAWLERIDDDIRTMRERVSASEG